MPFHSHRPAEAANHDAQIGQMPQELPTPLVNLAVDQVPSFQKNDSFIAGMLLAGMNGEAGVGEPMRVADERRNFEDALRTDFPEKYKLLKDNANNLRLELCLPQDASLEQIAERLYKLRKGEWSRFSCRQA